MCFGKSRSMRVVHDHQPMKPEGSPVHDEPGNMRATPDEIAGIHLSNLAGGPSEATKYLHALASSGTPGPTSPPISDLYFSQGRGFMRPPRLPPFA
jgi:hypothetical protein